MKTKLISLFFLIFLTMSGCNEPTPTPPTPTIPGDNGVVFSTGLVRPLDRKFGVMYWRPRLVMGTYPDSFDWREKGLSTPVRDQGSCGSCWAFASLQTLEGSAKIFGGKDIDLSEQEVTSCNKGTYKCDGGWFAGDYLVHGVATEASFPYVAKSVACKTIPSAEKAVSWANIGNPTDGPTTDGIKQAIMNFGYVAVSVSAGGSWGSYKSGTYSHCQNGGLNHEVTLVGWRTENGKTVWIMKNSWGESWGDKGYGYWPEGCDGIGREDASYIVYNTIPCKPPNLKLPSQYVIVSGDEVVLAVRKIDGVTYSWYQGTTKIGEGNELIITPTDDGIYRMVAKNNCGEAEIQTMVTLKK